MERVQNIRERRAARMIRRYFGKMELSETKTSMSKGEAGFQGESKVHY